VISAGRWTQKGYAWLDIGPPRVGEIQRRVIQVNREGGKVWREFDVVRAFESEEEAKEYADRHMIEDVEF
jgi:hypothetical protein